MLSRFIRWNIDICNRIEARLPRHFTRSLLYLHELTVAELMNARPGLRVLDIGGGHLCPFARHRKPGLGTEIIASDILEEQLRRNTAADGKFAADATRALPLKDATVDVLATRSVMEHLEHNEPLLREAVRVLRPAGRFVSVFPCRNTPFAWINRLIPNALAKFLLGRIFPEWKDECAFRAHYDNCTHAEMRAALGRAGFEIERVELRYYQAIYFRFLVPVYLLVMLYDLLMWSIDLRPLACQMLVVARRP
jgi:SAM-dependent methyltransferase